MIVTVCAAACTYGSLPAALAHAAPATTIVVRGPQHGDVIVARSVTIRGEADASVSGGGVGITIAAPRVTIEGLRFHGFVSDDISGQHAALLVNAPYARVLRNRFDGNAFAVNVQRADGTIIGDNLITGLARSQPEAAGDAVRVWSSKNVEITGNTMELGRDVFVSYSPGLVVRDNVIRSSRYGMHTMFTNEVTVTGNRFDGNEIGANFMYARGLVVTGNTFLANHGPTGYGIGLEDVDSSRISGNRIIRNHVGVNTVDSPTDPAQPDSISANLFAHNGSGLSVQSNPHALRIIGNGFLDNLEDVEVSGGGTAGGIVWNAAGAGNYWSTYAGYDRNGDGIGDIPYAPRAAFESLTDAHPELQMFRYSPAAEAVEFAARALPATASEPKLVDNAPRLTLPPQVSMRRDAPANPLAALLALLSVVPIAAGRALARVRHRTADRTQQNVASGGTNAIEARGVRKLYAAGRGVDGLDLCVRAGEAVALWGPNGAGKTTFFRCVLGERLDAGTLSVFGRIPSPNERETRVRIGYAPQHLPDFDSRVSELARLVAAIRGASETDAGAALHLLHLDAHADRFINELSGGMRQRLAIALALIGDPPLLLLDEPTAGLDRQSREIVVSLLQAQRAAGKTLLITSHLLEDVRALADRVIVLDEGRAVAQTSTPEFVSHYLRSVS